MSPKTKKQQAWAVTSYVLTDAYTDFILSRQAKLCSPETMRFYQNTAGKFLGWLEDVTRPDEITARHIRGYLAELRGRGLADTTIHNNARAIRTLMRFFFEEDYLLKEIKFDMPKIGKRKLLVLSADEVRRLIKACTNVRDVAIVSFLVDTGVRRAEFCSLDWGDIDIANGLIQIRQGKGRKYRPVVAGVKVRRALLKYRRSVSHDPDSPMFQTIHDKRFTHSGLRSCLLRIGELAGLKVNAHALRRTFATLALRGKMGIAELSRLMGHAEIQQTAKYVLMLDADLLAAHEQASPIDRL